MLVKDTITNRIFIDSSYEKEAKSGAAYMEIEQPNRCHCHRNMLDQNT